MDLTYTSPIKFDFFPIIGSTLTFQFQLKASKIKTKVNVDTHIFYKDPYIAGKVFLANSGPQCVYTSSQDQSFSLKFKIPAFNQRVQSYINISMENPNFQQRIIIEDMRIDSDMTYAHPSAALAVPNLHPKTVELTSPVNIQEWYDKIMFVSTWDIKCGIAQYTKDLLDELEKIKPGSFMIKNIWEANNIGAKLVHLQHEFSIMPRPPNVGGKVIITWHTIPKNISDTIRQFESKLDVVAHIIPCEAAREYMKTTKDVHVISLGSKIIPQKTKEEARKSLGINIDTYKNKHIGFVFGFQSPNKNYNQLINAAKNYGIHLIISGSTHFGGWRSDISNGDNVTFLDRHLTDEEIDSYALASDLLLFDYALQDHYSCSSAMHRIVGSGRPIVCTNSKHFTDINGPPKFMDQRGLEESINYALTNIESLSRLSLEFAQKTSREEVANSHINVYSKYVNLD